MADYDYTAGDSVPEAALSADHYVIAGKGTTTIDPQKVESENSFRDLTPGDYVLQVNGFGEIKPAVKTTHINGQVVNYQADQIEVRLSDSNDLGGSIRLWLLLPPPDETDLYYYANGTNANGKAAGFMAGIFYHFIDKLFPGGAFVVNPDGSKDLTDQVKSLGNWKGRKVWAQVEAGKESGRIDQATGDPYPARPQIKTFSFRAYVPGGPNPYVKAGTQAPQAKPAPGRPAPRPVANGAAAAGLGNV